MSFDTLRVYEAGRFYDVALPDWYEEADRLSRSGNASWHHAFTRVLGCYPERALVEQLGAKLYGKRVWAKEERRG